MGLGLGTVLKLEILMMATRNPARKAVEVGSLSTIIYDGFCGGWPDVFHEQ